GYRHQRTRRYIRRYLTDTGIRLIGNVEEVPPQVQTRRIIDLRQRRVRLVAVVTGVSGSRDQHELSRLRTALRKFPNAVPIVVREVDFVCYRVYGDSGDAAQVRRCRRQS